MCGNVGTRIGSFVSKSGLGPWDSQGMLQNNVLNTSSLSICLSFRLLIIVVKVDAKTILVLLQNPAICRH